MEDAHKISVTICGDGGCGKSSITLRLVRSQWTHEYDPTIEDSYSVTRTIDGTTYSLSITDTAGQEEYRGLWSNANLNSDAFLLVYDITQGSTLDSLQYFNQLIDQQRDHRMDQGQILPVCLVAGNKCDLQSMRQVGARDGLDWARSRGFGFMETSAREMVNIEETFALLVRRVVAARRQHLEGIKPNLPNFTSKTRPLEPLASPNNEKTTPLSPQWDVDPEPLRTRWWHKFKCWDKSS
ncbi:related to GTPase Ras2p [Ramularia collo-cygni]|uniref:Related to GTPase Ras2p n=1 Tax=Ramularia collo-cygni TaxID=112498 RepID=A0A2D3V612_9PEZI|nr:related to GTPase Ras2p [Ramularia collo-cygni]CZT20147.1 related to GTPase Ras2p [Ramularia collo-cygni]